MEVLLLVFECVCLCVRVLAGAHISSFSKFLLVLFLCLLKFEQHGFFLWNVFVLLLKKFFFNSDESLSMYDFLRLIVQSGKFRSVAQIFWVDITGGCYHPSLCCTNILLVLS